MAQPPIELRQNLQFIGEMLEQLRMMSPEQAGPVLPHLIDMARLEANEMMQKLRQPRSEM